ncbi:MAG TPA: AAA family ATPase [Chloroflexota bacterium]|nr:AAA family ATPase [Chloroflexota bacterium]
MDELSPARFGSAFKAFMDAVVAAAAPPSSPLLERIQAHLGADPAQLPVVAEEFDAFDHPNVQVALDDYLKNNDRRAELLGVAAENKRFMALSLSDVVSRVGGAQRPALAEGPVDYVNFHLADDRVLSCVQFGLYLIADRDARLVVFVTGPSDRMGPRQKVRVEAMASRPEDGQAFLAALLAGMARLNVYRGHVISLSPGQFMPGPQTLVAFHRLPTVPRGNVVLPDGLLERIERHTVVFSERAEHLLAGGRSLKRGLLLYGPPGTGKTLTLMYLVGRMPGRTVILTTGRGMGMVQTVAQMARTLAPAMVVLEDVDLIAEHRGQPFSPAGPLLFELLNEMDGLRDDCDVIFALTTNRPDILEPALAARPGRIDLAVELPLPGAHGRRRLLELYARGLELRGVDVDAFVERTEGVSPAYVKELLRKAALLAAEDGAGLVATGAHLEAAMAELNEGGRLAQRLLGFRPLEAAEPHPPGPHPMPPTGFPIAAGTITRIEGRS